MPTRKSGTPAVTTAKESWLNPMTVVEGQGICPFPSQATLSKYILYAKQIHKASNGVLHTLDRSKFEAMLDKLVGDSLTTEENWSAMVKENFIIQNWPFV